MNLVWFETTGYKRFAEHTKINLNEKLVAIVGPNEAGKTTLLRCLQHFNNRDPFVASGGSQELSRGVTVDDDDTVAEWTFAIDESDREALRDIPEAKNLRWYAIEKKKTGNSYFSMTDSPKRSLELRKKVREEVMTAGATAHSSDLGEDDEIDDSLLVALQELASKLETEVEDLSKDALESIATLTDAVRETEFETLAERLSELHAHEAMDSPIDRVASILSKRKPDFLVFTSHDRNLKSEYDLNKYFRKEDAKRKIWREEMPTALKNLAHAATLNLDELYTAQANDDRGRVKTILEKAEDGLTSIVRDSWTQSELSMSLELDGFRFQILLRSQEGEYVKVVERSDGLRQFVALLFFLARQPKSDCKPILLIDEAESRLHYDAQADLVQVLAKQTLASKVIYTTHSIGCLPEDLGSGVRMIAADDPYSTIENFFWNSERPGFSPLLFSMGAQTLAFLPMRYAVIAEGAADLILVPAILKAGLKQNCLGFQVVPGLSSSTSEEIAILDNESARTAYLVDGDGAGRKMKSKILEAGVSENMIITLPIIESEETVIEDYIPVESYVAAVSEELRRSGCSKEILADDLSRPNRPKRLEKWCKNNGVGAPSKRAVAYQVVENKFESPIVDDLVIDQVRNLYTSITNALRL